MKSAVRSAMLIIVSMTAMLPLHIRAQYSKVMVRVALFNASSNNALQQRLALFEAAFPDVQVISVKQPKLQTEVTTDAVKHLGNYFDNVTLDRRSRLARGYVVARARFPIEWMGCLASLHNEV